jgi:hypothetical protein
MEREWRFHLEARIDALVAEGLLRADAERRARMEFGDPLCLREASRDPGCEAGRRDPLDVGMVLRQMRRSPGLPVVVILTIALGVGTNAAIFSVQRPCSCQLVFTRNARLVRLEIAARQRGNVVRPNYFDWKEQAASFDVIGAHAAGSFGMAMTGAGQPTRGNDADDRCRRSRRSA